MSRKSEEMDLSLPFQVFAFYQLIQVENPIALCKQLKEWLQAHEATGRIYVSHEGVNAQFSLPTTHAKECLAWLPTLLGFENVWVKIQGHTEQAFPRLTVKVRKQLVALDETVDMSKVGVTVSPQVWNQMLEQESNKVVVDVRNEYEWQLGHFEGAALPACQTFREFRSYAQQLKNDVNPEETNVMMYCTGGIRCEFYSAYLKEAGFKKVFQLEGGVLNHGAEVNGEHWKGKLFVFDDRLAVPVGSDDKEIIGRCHHCKAPTEKIYNCANTDCNALFLCCKECAHKFKGCCKDACCDSPRLRSYHEQEHKPFRRLRAIKET